MKIESTGFTEEDLKAFLQETVAFERTRAKDDLTLADRLEAARTLADEGFPALAKRPLQSAEERALFNAWLAQRHPEVR